MNSLPVTGTVSDENVRQTSRSRQVSDFYGVARQRGVQAQLDAKRGKGSHQTLYLDTAFTIIRNSKDEFKTGTMHAMCSQRGIKLSDLY